MRTVTHEGRRHAVVPVTMLVSGMLHGSKGPVYYSSEEIKKSTVGWNGKPVVRYHPQLFNMPVAAALPQVHNNQKIGIVFNAKFNTNRLQAEAWIDLERCATIDNRIVSALLGDGKIEVSTGLFMEIDERPSYFHRNGVTVACIGNAKNIVADHLAILPDQVGACSLADGCGLNNVLNQLPTVTIVRE